MSVPAAFLGVVLIWSTTPLAIKWSGEGPGFLFGVASRMVLGFVLCALFMAIIRQTLPVNKRALWAYAISGFSIYAMMMLVYWSSQYVPSGIVSVIYGLSPFATGVFASYWLGEKAFTTNKLIGMLISFGGLMLIFGNGLHGSQLLLMGMAGVFVGMIIQSATSVWVKSAMEGIPSLAFNTGGLAMASLYFIVTWLLFSAQLPQQLPTKALASIIYLGVFGSGLGFLLFFYILKHSEASRISLVTLITPIMALMLGSMLNHEELQSRALLGAALILSGLFLYEWKSLRKLMRKPEKEMLV